MAEKLENLEYTGNFDEKNLAVTTVHLNWYNSCFGKFYYEILYTIAAEMLYNILTRKKMYSKNAKSAYFESKWFSEQF